MDLRIWDPSGTKLAEDILTDDTPVLEFTATVKRTSAGQGDLGAPLSGAKLRR